MTGSADDWILTRSETGTGYKAEPSLHLGQSAPWRVVTNEQNDESFIRRPVGYNAQLVEIEPLLWEGMD